PPYPDPLEPSSTSRRFGPSVLPLVSQLNRLLASAPAAAFDRGAPNAVRPSNTSHWAWYASIMRKLRRAIAWPLALLAGAALLSRALFLDVWTIPEGDPRLAAAVAPTLSAGDIVVIFTRGTPGFGDLVRCPDPNNKDRFIAARVAGT